VMGDGGLAIGDWGLGPITTPQSPIPNPHRNFFYVCTIIIMKIFKYYIKLLKPIK